MHCLISEAFSLLWNSEFHINSTLWNPIFHTMDLIFHNVECRKLNTKVVQIIKCTCTVFIDNFRNISTNSSILVSVYRGSYDGYVKHKRNDPIYVPWDSQGNENNAISIAFCLDFLIKNENITSQEYKTKTVSDNIACRASYKPLKLEG